MGIRHQRFITERVSLGFRFGKRGRGRFTSSLPHSPSFSIHRGGGKRIYRHTRKGLSPPPHLSRGSIGGSSALFLHALWASSEDAAAVRDRPSRADDDDRPVVRAERDSPLVHGAKDLFSKIARRICAVFLCARRTEPHHADTTSPAPPPNPFPSPRHSSFNINTPPEIDSVSRMYCTRRTRL